MRAAAGDNCRMSSPEQHLPLESELPAEALRVLAQATRHATPCGDGQLVWHTWGHAGGEPLVLLHGGSGSWTHWIRNVEALAAAGRRVVVPDLPGFGDSARPPGGQDADAVAPVLADGIRQMAGDAPVDIAGFSFGGRAESPKPGRSGTTTRRPAAARASTLRIQCVQLPLPPCSSTSGSPPA